MTDEEIRNAALKIKKQIGVSFTAQAKAINMDVSTYCKIIRGQRDMPQKYREAISEYLDNFRGLLNDGGE